MKDFIISCRQKRIVNKLAQCDMAVEAICVYSSTKSNLVEKIKKLPHFREE
jgi:hypothetical protein